MINSLNWLIKLRWIALSLQMLAIPFAIRYIYLPYENLPFVILTLLGILSFNILCQFNLLKPRALTHLLFDLCSFILLILLCGKIQNPFWDLIYFHIMMAAFVLPKKQDHLYLPILFSLIILIFWSSSNDFTSIMFTFVPQVLLTVGMWVAMRSLGLLFLKQQKTIGSLENKRSLLEKNRQISLLVSGIVHELGTPLNTVRLKVDKLLRDSPEDAISRDLDILDKSVKRLEQTTHHLNLAQSGFDHAKMTRINLSELLETTVLALQKGKSFSFKSNIQSNVFALTNALSIQLFISNSMQNCIDENLKQASISLTQKNGSILLKIEDEGEGFSDYILKNFKAPYNTTKGQGRGLGLYNCALGLEACGGTLNIYNNSGAVLELYLEGIIDD